MPATIPLPPAPSPYLLAVLAGLCILGGAVLLLWGRSNGRVLLTFIAAGVGAACAQPIVHHTAYKNVWVVGLAGALTAGLVVFVLARLIWAALLGALLAAASLAVTGWVSPGAVAVPPAWADSPTAYFSTWCLSLVGYGGRWLRCMGQESALALMLAGGVPALIGIGLGLFWPEAMLILVTSLLGAAALVTGVALGVWAGAPQWLVGWGTHMYIPAAAAGLLALIGLAVQTRAALRLAAEARRKKSGKEDQQAGQGQARPTGRKQRWDPV